MTFNKDLIRILMETMDGLVDKQFYRDEVLIRLMMKKIVSNGIEDEDLDKELICNLMRKMENADAHLDIKDNVLSRGDAPVWFIHEFCYESDWTSFFVDYPMTKSMTDKALLKMSNKDISDTFGEVYCCSGVFNDQLIRDLQDRIDWKDMKKYIDALTPAIQEEFMHKLN